jgi:hypothetical protein
VPPLHEARRLRFVRVSKARNVQPFEPPRCSASCVHSGVVPSAPLASPGLAASDGVRLSIQPTRNGSERVARAPRVCCARLVPLFITPFEPTHPYNAYGLETSTVHWARALSSLLVCVGCAIRGSPLLYHASLFPPQCALVITAFPGEVDHHSEVVGSVALHRPVRGGAQPRAGAARARRRRAQVDIVEAVERLVAPAS